MLLLAALPAFAGTIIDLQTGVYTVGSEVVVNGEAYEGCFIMVTDGMVVVIAPNSYGEWRVEHVQGEMARPQGGGRRAAASLLAGDDLRAAATGGLGRSRGRRPRDR